MGTVRIQEEERTDDEPVPGTSSKQQQDDELSLLSEILPGYILFWYL